MNSLFRSIGMFFLEIIETVVIALSIFLIIYLFIASPHQVDGHSMDPTFATGDYILSDKVSYRIGKPQRGDVVVFHAPASADCPVGTGCDFIKRIIGLPGETVTVHDNHIYINNQKLTEPYIPFDFKTEAKAATKNTPITLLSTEYFVVGDNRQYSNDSRAWGPITIDEIVGKAIYRYWPLSSAGTVKHERYAIDPEIN